MNGTMRRLIDARSVLARVADELETNNGSQSVVDEIDTARRLLAEVTKRLEK